MIPERGTIWVARNLAIYHHPIEYWIENPRTRKLRPGVADDFASVESRPIVFRRLTREWYSWLSNACERNRERLTKKQTLAIEKRMQPIHSIALAWWGEEVARIRGRYYVSATYQPPRSAA